MNQREQKVEVNMKYETPTSDKRREASLNFMKDNY